VSEHPHWAYITVELEVPLEGDDADAVHDLAEGELLREVESRLRQLDLADAESEFIVVELNAVSVPRPRESPDRLVAQVERRRLEGNGGGDGLRPSE
jgi:hypothetical protein